MEAKKRTGELEVLSVGSIEDAAALVEWCICNDHKVVKISITYEVDGLANEDDEVKVRYIETILAESEPVTINSIAKDYGIRVSELYRILHDAGFLEYGKHGLIEIGPEYRDDKDGFLLWTDQLIQKGNDVKVFRTLKFTRRARIEIHTILTECGIEPVMDRVG